MVALNGRSGHELSVNSTILNPAVHQLGKLGLLLFYFWHVLTCAYWRVSRSTAPDFCGDPEDAFEMRVSGVLRPYPCGAWVPPQGAYAEGGQGSERRRHAAGGTALAAAIRAAAAGAHRPSRGCSGRPRRWRL